jgi:hypothetical protein
MKHFLLFVFALVINSGLIAQVTITNTTFPKKGDVLKYAENINPTYTLDLKSNAGPHQWEFNMLTSGRKIQESYLDPKTGKDAATFADADIMLKEEDQEEYYKTSATKIEALGFGGINPIFNAPVVVKYVKRPALRQAPLSFISNVNTEGEFRIAIPASVFPDSILAIFPAGFKPDSIRVEFVSTTSSLMDAYGKLQMQGQNLDVLREKASETSQTKISVKIGFLGWQNLETLIGLFPTISLPPFIKQFLGVNKTTTYNFYNKDKKEILVSATYDSINVLETVVFADYGNVINAVKDSKGPTFTLYPNPVSDMITINTENWQDGMYLITIADLSGKISYAEPTQLSAQNPKQINISDLNSGVYILTIRDQFNKMSGSTRLVVLD